VSGVAEAALSFTVLGSGTALPDPDRGPAGFLVRLGARAWLVDGGTGTLQRCARVGVDPRALDGGFYSHRHPDHCADLVPLLFAMRVPPARSRDYPIVAGRGFRAFFEGLSAVYGKWVQPGSGAVQITELSLDGPDGCEVDGLRVTTRPAQHSGGALHLRFEAGDRAVVFSGDTGPSEALAELAAGVDLLVCECGATREALGGAPSRKALGGAPSRKALGGAPSRKAPVPGHLTAEDVAAVADAARPRAVWLTHLYPGVDPAQALRTVAATGVPVRRADDLDRFP
jgi:ribonuclease BN (tRNA processing enzyme)